MKRTRTELTLWAMAVAFVVVASWFAAIRAGTMQTASTTNELVMLNPYTINTNTFVVSEGSVGDTTATVWTFVNGDATGPDATHLAPTLYPAAGRWVKNAGGSGGTNIFNTLVVTNLYITTNIYVIDNDTNRVGLWIETNSVLRPLHLDLPVMLTNQLSFSEGMTNIMYRSGKDLIITNGGTQPGLILKDGSANSVGLSLTPSGSGVLNNSANSIFLPSVYNGTASFQPVGGVPTLGDDSSGSVWTNQFFGGTNYHYGFGPGTTNRVRLEKSMNGPLAVFDLTAKTNNVNAPITGFSFRTNGVEIFSATGSGGPSSGANWVASGTTNSTLAGGFTAGGNSTNNAQMYIDQLITPSIRLRRYVLTHAGTLTLDWSTNTVQKVVLTGDVTIAVSNLETNRTYDLIIANSQATNCTITWPTNCLFFGYKPTYISAYRHGWFQGQVGPQTNTTVYSAYAEQQ